MHYRRKHPTGKPQLRKNSSDWVYPQTEKGRYKWGKASARRWAAKFPLSSTLFNITYRKR